MATVTQRPEWTPDEIERLREWSRESKTSFAKRLGISWFTAHAWEKGTRHPKPEHLRLLDAVASEEHFETAA